MPTDRLAPPAHPDAGIPDLIHSLASDVKRLAADEVQLARIEVKGAVRDGARGALWFAVAFGVAVIAAIALTVALVAGVAALIGDNYWLGALIVGIAQIGVGAWLVKRGMATFGASDRDERDE